MKAKFGQDCHTENARADKKLHIFEIPTDIIINAFKEIQLFIFKKVTEFSSMNIGVRKDYKIDIVCAGGMGSSKFFFESMTEYINSGG